LFDGSSEEGTSDVVGEMADRKEHAHVFNALGNIQVRHFEAQLDAWSV